MTKAGYNVRHGFWATVLLVAVLAACGGAQQRSDSGASGAKAGSGARKVDPNDPFAGGCSRQGEAGKTVINPECIRCNPAVAENLTIADLGTVAVASVEIVGNATLGASREVIRRSHDDTMGITEVLTRRFIEAGVPMAERDKALANKMFDELEFSASGAVDDASAPAIGHQQGAKTLVVSQFEFNGEFDYGANEGGDIILREPKSISYQAIRIKGLDVSRGLVVFDVRYSITGNVSKVLMPKVLAQYAVQDILKRLRTAGPRF
jgi:hypothetical protein